MQAPSSKRFKPSPQKRQDKVVFKVELFSTHTEDKESEAISFPEGNPPITIATIKEKVEQNFNIPQSLSYDSCPLNDDASLEATRIRSGGSTDLYGTSHYINSRAKLRRKYHFKGAGPKKGAWHIFPSFTSLYRLP